MLIILVVIVLTQFSVDFWNYRVNCRVITSVGTLPIISEILALSMNYLVSLTSYHAFDQEHMIHLIDFIRDADVEVVQWLS